VPVVLTNGAKTELSEASVGPFSRIVLRDYRVEKVIQKRVCKCDAGGRENPSMLFNGQIQFLGRVHLDKHKLVEC